MDPISNSERNACFPGVPEGEATPAPAARPPEAGADVVSRHQGAPASTAPWVGDDSRGELFLREKFAALRSNESLELSGMAEVKLGLSAKGASALRVERQEDGGFLLTVSSDSAAGEGAPVQGSARLGAGGEASFRLANAEQTADLCNAFLETALLTAGQAPTSSLLLQLGTRTAAALGMGDAPDRLLRHGKHLSEVRFDLTESTQLGDEASMKLSGFDLKALGAKAKQDARASVAVDLERGELRYEVAGSVGAEAFIGVPPVFAVGTKPKVELTAAAVFSLPEAVKQAWKDGSLTADELVKQLGRSAWPSALVVRGEASVASTGMGLGASGDVVVTMKAERRLDVEKLRHGDTAAAIADALQTLTWSLESEVGVGASLGASVGVGKVEVSALTKTRFQLQGELSTPDAFAALARAAAADDSATLDACRAVSRR